MARTPPPRIDLFTSPECPASPRAREVVAAVALRLPGLEVHEWDLARDPGPAAGRGIFATPALLLNGSAILLGVPSVEELLRRLGQRPPAAVRSLGSSPHRGGDGGT